MRLTPLALLFAGLALWIVLWPLASRADDVPFAGTWASDAGQCKTDQSVEGAPLILTATSYNQGEAHCTFDSVSQDSGAWLAKAKCSVEGEDSGRNLHVCRRWRQTDYSRRLGRTKSFALPLAEALPLKAAAF